MRWRNGRRNGTTILTQLFRGESFFSAEEEKNIIKEVVDYCVLVRRVVNDSSTKRCMFCCHVCWLFPK